MLVGFCMQCQHEKKKALWRWTQTALYCQSAQPSRIHNFIQCFLPIFLVPIYNRMTLIKRKSFFFILFTLDATWPYQNITSRRPAGDSQNIMLVPPPYGWFSVTFHIAGKVQAKRALQWVLFAALLWALALLFVGQWVWNYFNWNYSSL